MRSPVLGKWLNRKNLPEIYPLWYLYRFLCFLPWLCTVFHHTIMDYAASLRSIRSYFWNELLILDDLSPPIWNLNAIVGKWNLLLYDLVTLEKFKNHLADTPLYSSSKFLGNYHFALFCLISAFVCSIFHRKTVYCLKARRKFT